MNAHFMMYKFLDIKFSFLANFLLAFQSIIKGHDLLNN